MRRERTDKDKLYLKCCRRSKCNATISILIKNAIGTEKSSGTRYALKPDVTDEILLNKEKNIISTNIISAWTSIKGSSYLFSLIRKICFSDLL